MNTSYLGLIIFAFSIILFVWDKLPMATSAILGCTFMVLFGVCDFSTAFGQFASSTVIMLIGVLVMGAAFSETGLAAKIGWTVARFSKNNERIFILLLFLTAYSLSLFLTNASVLAMFLPIVFSLADEHSGINPLNVVIPLTLAVNIGGITTLIGSSQQMTAQGLLIEYGYDGFNIFDFTPFGLILAAVILAYVLFIGYPIGKKIWGGREFPIIFLDPNTNVPPVINKEKSLSVCVIFGISMILYAFRGIPFTNIVIQPQMTSTIAALACILMGCISQKKAIEGINWNIVGRLGACLGLAKALESCGAINLISEPLLELTNNSISPFVLFAAVTLCAQLISLFVSNSTAISIALIFILSIAPELSLNVHAYAMGIVLAASMGASCPLSGSTWGMSLVAGYKFRDYFKYGAVIDLLAYIIILIFVPMFIGLTV